MDKATNLSHSHDRIADARRSQRVSSSRFKRRRRCDTPVAEIRSAHEVLDLPQEHAATALQIEGLKGPMSTVELFNEEATPLGRRGAQGCWAYLADVTHQQVVMMVKTPWGVTSPTKRPAVLGGEPEIRCGQPSPGGAGVSRA